MLKPDDEAVSGADKAPLPPDATTLELKVQPDDAIFGTASLKNDERASTQKGTSFLGRLLRSVVRTVTIVFLCGLAWAGGAYYSHGRLPLDPIKSSQASEVPQGPDVLRAVRQMDEEIRALKTSVEGTGVARDAAAEEKPNSMQTATGATVTDLVGRIDKLDAEFTAKLSQVNEQLASIEKQIAASHAAVASRGKLPHRHAEHLHDAFDPSQAPNAPGAPHQLGSW